MADCSAWMRELDEGLPTVVLDARVSTGDRASSIKVFVDGQLLTDKLDGKALPIDPGEHAFRFVTAGEPPLSKKIVVLEGVKNQKVSVRFGGEPDVQIPPKVDDNVVQGRVTPPQGPLPPQGTSGKRVASFVLGGVGVAAMATAIPFWLKGQELQNDACGVAKNCAQGDIDDHKKKLLIGDVFFGVGAVSAGIGVYLFVSSLQSPAPAAAAVQWNVGPMPGGAAGTLRGQF